MTEGPPTPTEPSERPPDDETLVGRTVGRFAIVDCLGAGGMGAVYVADDETLGRRVALKAIRHDRTFDLELRLRFQREARALSQLDHPHVCRIYDYFEGDGQDFLVLELIEGQTLDQWARGRDRRAVLAVARDVARALGAAHECGIVHRDLKPGNVMVNAADEAKVLDFGLAAAAQPPDAGDDLPVREGPSPTGESSTWSGDAVLTEDGVISGTPRYMSPEQANGRPLSTASDVYSLGLILQELVTGEAAIQPGLNAIETWELAKEGRTQPFDDRDRELRGLVGRMLAQSVSERPTAREVAATIEHVLGRRRRRALAAGGAAAVLLALFGVVKYVVDLSVERNAALEASDEADRRRVQAEDLLGFMLGDLRDELVELNSLAILDAAAERVEAYYEHIPDALMSDEERIRRSQMYYQLGELRLMRGDLSEAGRLYARSLATIEPLARSAPEDLDRLMALGAGQYYVGYGLMEGGDTDAARTYFAGYLATAQLGDELSGGAHEWRLEVGWASTALGALELRSGAPDAALVQFGAALDLFRAMHEDASDDPDAQLELADILSWHGRAQVEVGRARAAMEDFEEELILRESLLAGGERDTVGQSRLANCETWIGTAGLDLDLAEVSLEHFERARARYGRLWAQDPENTAWRREHAALDAWCGRAYESLGRFGQARERLQAALVEFEALVALDPTNDTWADDRASTAATLDALP